MNSHNSMKIICFSDYSQQSNVLKRMYKQYVVYLILTVLILLYTRERLVQLRFLEKPQWWCILVTKIRVWHTGKICLFKIQAQNTLTYFYRSPLHNITCSITALVSSLILMQWCCLESHRKGGSKYFHILLLCNTLFSSLFLT